MTRSQTTETRNVRIVIVAGVDSGSGAGLVRDAMTARRMEVAATLVGTAWTDQGPSGVRGVEPRAPEAVAAALAGALPGAGAVKIGMVATPAVAGAVVQALDLARFAGPVVVDPVLGASAGGRLWAGAPDELLALLARATVATPNAVEAGLLTGRPVASRRDAERAAAELRAGGVRAVLIKGGHLPEAGPLIGDLLADETGARWLEHPRRPGPGARGTGCTLATALAALLGQGLSLAAAAERATTWLGEQLAAAVEVGGERHLP